MTVSTSMEMPSRCPYCSKLLPTGKAVRQHVAASQSCSKSWEKDQLAKIPTKTKTNGSDVFIGDEDLEMDGPTYEFVLAHEGPEPANTVPVAVDPDNTWPEENDDQPSSRTRYSEAYPRSAGQPIRKEMTQFEKFRDNDSVAGRQPWEPFSSKKEWELATWIIKNVNQRATEQYLNLPIVSVSTFLVCFKLTR